MVNRLTGDIDYLQLVHELSGPLTAAKINLEQYLLKPDQLNLSLLGDNLALIEDYLTNARRQIQNQATIRHFSSAKLIKELGSSLNTLAKSCNVSLRIVIEDDVVLKADAVKFKQILSSIIRNAIEAYDQVPSDQPKEVLVKQKRQVDYLVISITDHGHGIKSKDMPKIFDLFYSTKKARDSGLGVGLSLVKKIIEEDFSGKIKVNSRQRQGTTISLYFKP